jgi:AraC-like DNA-binding protein
MGDVADHSRYREFRPRGELAALVACTWEREVVSAEETAHILPDGCVDLVWDGDERLYAAGPDTGPFATELHPGSVIVGLRLRRGLAGGALAHPANELRDARVPLEALWGRDASELAERLADAEGTGRKRAILEDALVRRLPRIDEPDPLVLRAIGELGKPAARVSSLSEAVFVSERHLRRLFHEAVGYGPKTLDRVLRFQRFLSRGPAVASGAEDLAGVAAELGYADQAHLTRECVRLAGLSPRRLVETWTP